MDYVLDHKSHHLKINSDQKIILITLGIVFLALFLYGKLLSLTLKKATINNNYSFFSLTMEKPIKILPGTEDLMNRLEKEGYAPSIASEIERNFFSVPGVIVTLDGDNIKVFEHKDNLSAEVDALLFSESAGTDYYAWRKKVNLYLKDNIVVFYMGSRKSVLDALKNTVGEPIKL